MGRLLGFLQSDADKADKVRAIKAARADGLVDEDQTLELTIEFC